MKKIFLLTLLLIPLSLFAQETDDIVFKLENDPHPFFPFSIAGSYVSVSPTKFRTRDVKENSLTFQQWEAVFAYTHPFTPIWGLLFGAGWVGNEVKMENNPKFDETIFNYYNFLVGAYTKSFPNWLWKLTFAAYLDTEEFSFIDYTLYQGVLWGKYDLNKRLELDFGFIVESGLNKTKVWPILGFIYYFFPKWEISAVYPIDVSINYIINSYLVASGSLRFLRTRHRLKETAPEPQGIFEYHTTGVEFDLTFSPGPRFTITGFMGSTLNGDLKVSNRTDNHATHFKFNGSFYGGASALFGF